MALKTLTDEGPNDRGPDKPSTPGLRPGQGRPQPLFVPWPHNEFDLLPIATAKEDGKRSHQAKRTCPDKSRHAILTPQGLKGQQSPRPDQMTTPRHAAWTRQHRTVVLTGTKPTVQIHIDKT
jgi:hypothetical protein